MEVDDDKLLILHELTNYNEVISNFNYKKIA
jgi:hypothetical protein